MMSFWKITEKKPLYSYVSVRVLWKMNGNGGKRLTKKERIALRRILRDAKKNKAWDDKYIDSQNNG